MYLSPQFFANKAVDVLIGPGVEAGDLNDDPFGKTPDALYDYGCTKLFTQLGSSILLAQGLGMRVGHYDQHECLWRWVLIYNQLIAIFGGKTQFIYDLAFSPLEWGDSVLQIVILQHENRYSRSLHFFCRVNE